MTPSPGAPSPLVDAAWLAARIADPSVRIADVRWYLAGKRGADEYARGHLPGAVFVDLDRDLAGPAAKSSAAPGSPSGGPGRHPLPSAHDFAETLARLGVTRDTTIVAYDDAGGAIAARLWWLLRYFGHAGGRVLDGGITAWVSAGHALSTTPPPLVPAPPLDLAPGSAPVLDKSDVDRLRRDPRTVLLDARARDRFEGKSEPIDARAGHIPGARSAPFSETLVAPGGRIRPVTDLEDHYRALGAFEADTVVCYCGSGVTACHTLLTLTLAGRSDALLYEGSWSDWSSDPALPAASGQ